MSNDLIKKMSFDEYKTNSTEIDENGKKGLTIEKCYQTYDMEMSKLIDIIQCQTIEIDQLKNAKKKVPKAFDHTTDKKIKAKAIKMLKERYTIKYVATELGISESTVNRIKKAEGLTTSTTKAEK